MDQTQNNPKHIKAFWAVVAVAVVALVLGGVIYFYANNNELQDDIYSISFSSPVQIHKKPAAAVKSPTSTPVSEKKVISK